MLATVTTAGVRLGLDCPVPWVSRLLAEALSGETVTDGLAEPDAVVRVERNSAAFAATGLPVLTRGARGGDGLVLLADVCTSGFDLLLDVRTRPVEFLLRWRPPTQERVVHRLMSSRFHLLARSVLLHYPALWWAGVNRRAPLHASAVTTPAGTVLLAGPGGVGKSTLLAQELGSGGRATSDNVCVSDGERVWGLVEPLRTKSGSGRRMPHGRRESSFPAREPSLAPDRVVAVVRGPLEQARLTPATQEEATRCLVTGTYLAGELRRYWGYAAALAAGTPLGPAHPDVTGVAALLAAALPCSTLTLPGRPGTRLSEVLTTQEAEQCS